MTKTKNWKFNCPFCGTTLALRPNPALIGEYRNCFGCGEPFLLKRKESSSPENSVEISAEALISEPKKNSVKAFFNNEKEFSHKKMIADRYSFVKELGRGGMGAVYQVHDTKLNRDVALKTIIHEEDTENQVKRFIREAKTSQKLDHPNIVKIYDIGHIDHIDQYGDSYFFTMELIEGTALDLFIQKNPIHDIQSIEIVQKIAYAIDYAHSKKIIHRDLKPANIMMQTDFEPKLVDFGLAKRLSGENTEQLTAEGVIVGTIQYMSPEQICGDDCLKNSTDIYSLGVILYELLTGSVPFKGDSIIELYDRITTEDAISPSEISSWIPESLSQICLKAMAKKPEDRFAIAKEFGDALAIFLP